MTQSYSPPAGINSSRLFLGSCIALIATAFVFVVVGKIMGPLKEAFVLTNYQVGCIGGAGLWGFTVSIFVFGPLCDALGMNTLLRLAFFCHVVGVCLMIFASGFWMLLSGCAILAMGNGLVEAAGNPLVATIYPDRKTEKLNVFHVWFPGGIVIGGLLAFGLDKITPSWQMQLALILVPTFLYGIIFIGQRFPATERAQSGVSFGGMFQATFLRPFFLLFLGCMMITASLELGPNRWVTAVLESGGKIPGLLVLIYISTLMAVLRSFAGPIVHKLMPTGILFFSAIVAGLGLWWLSFVSSTAMAFAAATVFAIGVCYFWPTMLGVVAECVPKGGALALAVLGGTGALMVGLVTSPLMGEVADRIGHQRLDPVQTKAVLSQVIDTFPALAAKAKGKQGKDYEVAVDNARKVLAAAKANNGVLPVIVTATALRGAINAGGDVPAAQAAKALMDPADNYGGLASFRYVAPFSILLAIIFGILYFSDRARGGYKVVRIGKLEE